MNGQSVNESESYKKRRRSSALSRTSIVWKNRGQGDSWSILQNRSNTETRLIRKRNDILSMVNFDDEPMGLREFDKLLENLVVIVNPEVEGLQSIFSKILSSHELKDKISPSILAEDVVAEMFVDFDNESGIFSKVGIQGLNIGHVGGTSLEPSWFCTLCNLQGLKERIVAIAKFRAPTNLGELSEELRFLIVILSPTKTKETKSALEAARIFCTIFSFPRIRQYVWESAGKVDFKCRLREAVEGLQVAGQSGFPTGRDYPDDEENISITKPGKGVISDLRRRLRFYVSDYVDAFRSRRSLQKTLSTTAFLYFACLLPTIAFANLNAKTTNGVMNARKGIFMQAVGQLAFSLFGGQFMNILLTTAPLCLFVTIINGIAVHFGIGDQFAVLYCLIGLWSSFFLALSGIFNVSVVMKWCSRFTEEIFAVFISVAFVIYAARDVYGDFAKHYAQHDVILGNMSGKAGPEYQLKNLQQAKEQSLLFLLITLGTFWFGMFLFNFRKTPFLSAGKRELLSDYSLPAAVIVFSLLGSFVFRDIPIQNPMIQNIKSTTSLLVPVNLGRVTWMYVVGSLPLGLSLAILIFMDQNIGAAIVNSPANQLQKGPAYHYDLVVVAVINTFSSMYTLPFLHVALPHAPLHVRSLAEMEEKVMGGNVMESIVSVHETRVPGIISHVLIGLTLFLLPYPLEYIMPPVFDGMYLIMGITALEGNQFFERILLFFTEQVSYPPTHYVRNVPQRKMHTFTLVQILMLAILCGLGFADYPFAEMAFPLVLILFLVVRRLLLPKVIEEKYLRWLDSH